MRIVIALFVTAAFTAYAATHVNFSELFARVANLGYARTSLGVLVVLATMTLRAARLCLALGERLNLVLGCVSIVHNALVAILPAKLGEFALPTLLSRLGKTQTLDAVGLLVGMRVLDLLALAVVGGCASGLVLPSPLSWLSFLAAALGILLLGLLPLLSSRLRRSREGLLHPRARSSLSNRLALSISAFGGASGFRLGALSILIWASLFTSFYVFTGGPGHSWAAVAFEGTAGSLAFAIPVSGIGNLGPFQAAWVAASRFIGVADDALMRAIIAHGAVLVVTSLLGCVAAAYLLFRIQARPSEFKPNAYS